jgi:hypothetical protein
MNHGSCPDCRLRFTAATAAYLPACPECGKPLAPVVGPGAAVGFRLFRGDDDPHSLPEAVAVALPPPAPHAGGS